MDGILTVPTADNVKKAITEFRGWDDEPDPALNLLFAEHPKNTNLDHVLLKVVALNSLYSTMIRVNSKLTPSVYDVARHIVGLNIDAILALGSESLLIGSQTQGNLRRDLIRKSNISIRLLQNIAAFTGRNPTQSTIRE